MKIVSWNIERPKINKGSDKNIFIIELIKNINPEIVFLTETNSSIDFSSDYHKLQTVPLPEEYDHCFYHDGENRVTIFSRYKFMDRRFNTYDPYTCVCGEVVTPFGNLVLYGSIIGSHGIVGARNMEYFNRDFVEQQKEIKELIKEKNICYSGDLNMSFSSDWYQNGYPKGKVREMNDFFEETHLVNTTKQNKDCVIHIVLSENFVKGLEIKPEMMPVKEAMVNNMKRHISDHNLVMVDLAKI